MFLTPYGIGFVLTWLSLTIPNLRGWDRCRYLMESNIKGWEIQRCKFLQYLLLVQLVWLLGLMDVEGLWLLSPCSLANCVCNNFYWVILLNQSREGWKLRVERNPKNPQSQIFLAVFVYNLSSISPSATESNGSQCDHAPITCKLHGHALNGCNYQSPVIIIKPLAISE